MQVGEVVGFELAGDSVGAGVGEVVDGEEVGAVVGLHVTSSHSGFSIQHVRAHIV